MAIKPRITGNIPQEGIATDAAHSQKYGITRFQGINLSSGERLFLKDIGNQTVNIGEFLALVEAIRYILENGFQPRIIYTDSQTAIAWFKNMRGASCKKFPGLLKAEVFLKIMKAETHSIRIIHWDKEIWGEIPADFGNK